jgi:hypothetical protein
MNEIISSNYGGVDPFCKSLSAQQGQFQAATTTEVCIENREPRGEMKGGRDEGSKRERGAWMVTSHALPMPTCLVVHICDELAIRHGFKPSRMLAQRSNAGSALTASRSVRRSIVGRLAACRAAHAHWLWWTTDTVVCGVQAPTAQQLVRPSART